jgi:hypothetical protein
MWKISLLALLIGFNAYAETVADEMGGAEQQDGEDYAVTRGNPILGDDPIAGAPNDSSACLSADTVKRFEKKARPAVKAIPGIAAKGPGRTYSLRNVRLALAEAGLVKKQSSLGTSAANAGSALVKEKFVNLMNCEEWRNKIAKDPNSVPLGAVLIYSGGKHGDSRIKTPSGCIGATEKDTRCSGTGRKLTGIYVKVVN